jgi:hypothetical protein
VEVDEELRFWVVSKQLPGESIFDIYPSLLLNESVGVSSVYSQRCNEPCEQPRIIFRSDVKGYDLILWLCK